MPVGSADGLSLTGRGRSAHDPDEACPVALISTITGGFEYAVAFIFNAPKLPPDCDRRAAKLLELADAPAGCPGIHSFCGADRIVSVLVPLDTKTINVLGNVFCDIAGGRAFVVIDGDEGDAASFGARLVSILGQAIMQKSLAYAPSRLGRQKYKEVPVGAAVVVGLGDPKAIQLDAVAGQF